MKAPRIKKSLLKFGDGGTLPKDDATHYYTSDINDPRIKSYNDSLSAFNKYKGITDFFVNGYAKRNISGKVEYEDLKNQIEGNEEPKTQFNKYWKEGINNALSNNKDFHYNFIEGSPTIKVPFFTKPTIGKVDLL